MNMPAIAALSRLANVPARTAFNPRRAISERRLGAKPPSVPSIIAIEEKFANPHNAKLIIVAVF